MRLAIDIGNTSLKFALYEKYSASEKGIGIEQLSAALGSHGAAITGAMIAAVADSAEVSGLLRNFNIPYSLLSPHTALPIQNVYRTPETLGSDRIALAVAADRIFEGAPALAIGAGTCITYNFVHHSRFEGGAISPGITMRFQALQLFTAKLPYIDWAPYREGVFDMLTGPDSGSSIVSGVLNGILHEVNGTIEQYRSRYSGLRVAMTGGDGDFLVKNLKNDIFARPDMVLEGLNYILMQHA